MEVRLRDLLRADIFQHSKIVAGFSGLNDTVSSINVIDGISGARYARPKMLLITSGYFLAQSSPEKIRNMLQDFSKCGIAGLLSKVKYFENHIFPQFMIDEADHINLPLIELANDDATFTDFFSFFNSHLYCFGINGFMKFGNLTENLINAIKKNSLSGFASELHRLSGRNVVIHFNRDNMSYPADMTDPSTLARDLSMASDLACIRPARSYPGLKEYLRNDGHSFDNVVGLGINFDVQLEPLGSIWLDCHERAPDANDAILLENAKLAAELEIRQIMNFQQEELELRAKLIDKLLAGELKTWYETTLFIRGLKWHVPDKLRMLVILCEISSEKYQDICIAACHYFQKHDENILVHQYERNVIVFLPADMSQRDETIADLTLYLKKRFPSISVIMGLGRESLLNNANISYEEALFAARVGSKLKSPDSLFEFTKLGCYRLFSPAVFPDEMAKFCRDYLSPILEPDASSGSSLDLIGTLRTYFENGQHLSKTALQLHLQPNSVRYRLGVIEEACHINLSDHNDILSMQIAMALLDILGPDSLTS